ncbi:hypothetical protein D3C81_1458550 [compost metagenome]
MQHQGRRGDLRQRAPQAPRVGREDFRLAARPALQLDAALDLPQRMLDVGVQRRITPVAKDPAPVQARVGGGTVRPAAAPLLRPPRQGVALLQAEQLGQRHHADHRRREQHRIEQHRALEQRRLGGQDQAAEHPAEAVPAGKARHRAEAAQADLERLHGQLGAAVPAVEAAAVVAVAMALDVAQPQVEVAGQQAQQRLVGAPAEAVAVQEVQQRLARGLAVPAAQGEAGRGGMGPGVQDHGGQGCDGDAAQCSQSRRRGAGRVTAR